MYRSTYYQTYFNAHYLEAAAEKGKYVKEAGEAVGGGSLHWKPARRERDRDFQFQRGKSSFEIFLLYFDLRCKYLLVVLARNSKFVSSHSTRCENIRIFLSLRFYVKSVLDDLKVLKMPFLL